MSGDNPTDIGFVNFPPPGWLWHHRIAPLRTSVTPPGALMSAHRLGRLLGSLLLVSGLVVAAGVASEFEVRTHGIEWQMPTLGSQVR